MSFKPFNLCFQDVPSLNRDQATSLAMRAIKQNDFLQVISIEAEETLGCNHRLRIPDIYSSLLFKEHIFILFYYMEMNKKTLAAYLSHITDIEMSFKNRDISLKHRDMYRNMSLQDRDMSHFENAIQRPFSIQLKKQTLFLNDMIADVDGLAIKKIPLYILANLKGFLEVLEDNWNNEKFDLFGINQIDIGKFSSFGLNAIEKSRTHTLIFLINRVISTIKSVWEIDHKELSNFQAQCSDLFCYDAEDILLITYISSCYLSTIQDSSINSVDCVWELASSINPPWKWDCFFD